MWLFSGCTTSRFFCNWYNRQFVILIHLFCTNKITVLVYRYRYLCRYSCMKWWKKYIRDISSIFDNSNLIAIFLIQINQFVYPTQSSTSSSVNSSNPIKLFTSFPNTFLSIGRICLFSVQSSGLVNSIIPPFFITGLQKRTVI